MEKRDSEFAGDRQQRSAFDARFVFASSLVRILMDDTRASLGQFQLALASRQHFSLAAPWIFEFGCLVVFRFAGDRQRNCRQDWKSRCRSLKELL
jgi:hypothetical protein